MRPSRPYGSPSSSRRVTASDLRILPSLRGDVEAHVLGLVGVAQVAQHAVGGHVADGAAGDGAVLDGDDGVREPADVVEHDLAVRAEHLGQAADDGSRRPADTESSVLPATIRPSRRAPRRDASETRTIAAVQPVIPVYTRDESNGSVKKSRRTAYGRRSGDGGPGRFRRRQTSGATRRARSRPPPPSRRRLRGCCGRVPSVT